MEEYGRTSLDVRLEGNVNGVANTTRTTRGTKTSKKTVGDTAVYTPKRVLMRAYSGLVELRDVDMQTYSERKRK